MSVLYGIQDYVIAVAETIQKISGVDIEVIDEEHFRIAGTGKINEKVNQNNRDDGHGYRYCIENKKDLVIANPREHFICKECNQKATCSYYYELATPIIMDQKVIGVIAFLCMEEEKRAYISENLEDFMDFLKCMAELMVSRVKESASLQSHVFEKRIIETLIRNIDAGIIMTDRNKRILYASNAAMSDLKIDQYTCYHTFVNIVGTTGSFVNQTEYKVITKDHSFRAIGELYIIEENADYVRIFIYEDIKKYKAKREFAAQEPIYNLDGICGNEKRKSELAKILDEAAMTGSNVIIVGEKGNKKNVISSMIYHRGYRNNGKFLSIQCQGMDIDQMEKKLFGYVVRDSYTGKKKKIYGSTGNGELRRAGAGEYSVDAAGYSGSAGNSAAKGRV